MTLDRRFMKVLSEDEMQSVIVLHLVTVPLGEQKLH